MRKGNTSQRLMAKNGFAKLFSILGLLGVPNENIQQDFLSPSRSLLQPFGEYKGEDGHIWMGPTQRIQNSKATFCANKITGGNKKPTEGEQRGKCRWLGYVEDLRV